MDFPSSCWLVWGLSYIHGRNMTAFVTQTTSHRARHNRIKKLTQNFKALSKLGKELVMADDAQ